MMGAIVTGTIGTGAIGATGATGATQAQGHMHVKGAEKGLVGGGVVEGVAAAIGVTEAGQPGSR